mmetsp:Transcript_8036/g.17281  ORF Transcript_8036/g.17281 Transcript_8036/m.17281 type:complete len:231 (-) Transcript_8036:341-1033(-)
MPYCSCALTLFERWTFELKTYAASPASVSFARAITSDSSVNRSNDTIGPKISSVTILIVSVTPVTIVGAKYNGPACSKTRPPATTTAPFLQASSTSFFTRETARSLIIGPKTIRCDWPRGAFFAASASASSYLNGSSFSTRANTCARNRSYTVSCTYTRFAETHVCPAFRANLLKTNISAARPMSASSNTTNGAFPPSSMLVRRIRVAHKPRRIPPTRVDPVKLSFRTAL